MCLLMTAKNLLSPFALEVHMKESGILNCPKGEKVRCNLGGENQVQNALIFCYFRVHTTEGEPLYLPVYIHMVEINPVLKS